MKNLWMWAFTIIYTIVFFGTSFSQQEGFKKDQFLIGPDERLLITVHIWGEVQKPGEYVVPDDTDILELISKAGGPTEYSDLTNVRITRGLSRMIDLSLTPASAQTGVESPLNSGKQIIKLNLKKLVENENDEKMLPILKPGDVVNIRRNTWYRWQTAIRVISQLAIVAQVWFWYSRID